MSGGDVKYCSNCHCSMRDNSPMVSWPFSCTNPFVIAELGSRVAPWPVDCAKARDMAPCGFDGVLFQPKTLETFK